jgi:putative transcriptional regulator
LLDPVEAYQERLSVRRSEMQWNLRLTAAQRGIWRACDLRRLLAAAGLEISAGKMSYLWSGRPISIRLDDLDIICAVLGCDPGELLIHDPATARQPSPPPVATASTSPPPVATASTSPPPVATASTSPPPVATATTSPPVIRPARRGRRPVPPL